MVIAQAFPSDHAEELLSQRCAFTGLDVRERISFAFLMNTVWLPFFSVRCYWACCFIMLLYLAGLTSAYSAVNVWTTEGILERVVYAAPLAANTSWVVVAFMLNLTICLRDLGWHDENRVGGSPAFAKGAIALVAGLGCQRGFLPADLAWSLVAAHALMGISRMHTEVDKVRFPILSMDANIASWARWGAAAVCAASAAGLCLAAAMRWGS
ncbi:unnamed protein product [Polarella glacialis]|uniref:Uncharacterized protein n=1 Tax=Polarella glacialis TaxID=89957 RepID=A0A813FR66_POLGL|nr:unnamed protein product [Polarella glacialis]